MSGRGVHGMSLHRLCRGEEFTGCYYNKLIHALVFMGGARCK